jgi:DNA-binding LacI/PurR family transcriptional regulator
LNVRERARGYWAALAEVGIPEEEMPIHAVSRSDGSVSRSDGSNLGEALALLFADWHTAPTALLAMSDHMALAALDWLAAHGLRVPEDVSVVGFDGVPEAAVSAPPLTSVDQPYRQIAERAVAAILDGAVPQGREVLPLQLVVRGSTGPASA